MKYFYSKYSMLLLAFFWIGIYIHFMMYFPLDPIRFTLMFFAKVFIIAIVCNFGLVFISMNIARKFKKTAALLFFPSFIITPLIAGIYFIPAFFAILVFNIYLFTKFNPWKKMKLDPFSLKSEAKREAYKHINISSKVT
jgi:hypothetical protein